MKKAIYALMLCVGGLLFSSCEKDEVGSTATEALAGEWYVTVDAADEAGNTVAEDPFGLGHIFVLTYNTAADIPTEMYVSDEGNFWNYKVRVNSDVNNLTFSTNGDTQNEAYDCLVNIEDGRLLPQAATTPSGMPADSIVFYVSFSDDTNGFIKYKVSGYRYTGFEADEQ